MVCFSKIDKILLLVIVLTVITISMLFGLKILNNSNFYFLSIVAPLLGFLLGSIGKIKTINQLKQILDKVSIIFLSLFVILYSFIIINLALKMITASGIILILFFFDFVFLALFLAQYYDRKSQLEKEQLS
jgi:hypothetical protein